MRLHRCHWVCIRFYLAAFVYVLCICAIWSHSREWTGGENSILLYLVCMVMMTTMANDTRVIHFWWYQYHSVMTVSINHIIDMFNAHAVEAFYGHNGWNLRCTHHWRFIDHHFTIFSMGSATIHMTNITLWVNEQCPHFKCTRETKILEK